MPESDDDLTPQIPEGYVSRENIRDLEAKAAKAAALERELAFAKALGPSDDPRLGYFQKAYDGELTPEAIREAARRDGFLTTPAPTQPTQVAPQPDLEAQARIAGASTGTSPMASPDFLQKLGECKSREEVMALCAQTKYPGTDTFMSTSWNNQ